MLNSMVFGKSTSNFDIAILVPNRNFNQQFITQHYVDPLVAQGIDREQIVAFSLDYESTGKAPVGRCIKPHLVALEPVLKHHGVSKLLCCDGPYFKTITKVGKVESFLGYPKPTFWDENVEAFYCPNASALFRQPDAQKKIDIAIRALVQFYKDGGLFFQEDIIKFGRHAIDLDEQFRWLAVDGKLHKFSQLSCDIETTGLMLGSSILSIAFGMDQHSGVAIPVNGNDHTKSLLRRFFEHYAGSFIWHKGTFDTKQLIWNLWMRDSSDFEGMLRGLHVLHGPGKYDDTHTLSYLALNSCSGNDLSLKAQAFEFVGNYALDEMDNLANVDLDKLLTYNLRDVLATWYVYNKHRQTVQDTQESVYQDVYLPSLKTITQMEMVGLPLNPGQVLATEAELNGIQSDHLKTIESDPLVEKLNWELREQKAVADTKKLKKKVKVAKDYEHSLSFNPGSPKQLQVLLHDLLGLEVKNRTPTKQPATDAKSIKAHIEFLKNQGDPHNARQLLEAIVGWSEVAKITNTFIPAFKGKVINREGWNYLVGNFNLGVVKSGRQSSSDPNLQNIPSTGTVYAKPLKKCIQAPAYIGAQLGWLFVGADYASLEDRIGALISKDPNKLAVYEEGYDGHSLRAAAYFPNRMPDITQELSEAVNAAERVSIIESIKKRYPDLRQLSKGPTFALTYLGTWKTLVKTFGLTKPEAQEIEDNYHELYKVADEWARQQMFKAHQKGYVELAFGLRLRTPCLTQVLWEDESSWPMEAYKEKKTATNALGQSYGLLNTYTGNLFMQRVWSSKYATSILPAAQIHDAQYYIIRNDLDVLHWTNKNLIECMRWCDLPELQHPTVKLEADLEVFSPDWAESIELPNNASKEQIRKLIRENL